MTIAVGRFSEQVVMITGAAGALGASMSHAFADEGATVVVTGRKEQQGLALATALGGDLNRRLTSLGRYASPTEIATVTAFLASPAASYMTGSVVTVDGGYNA